MLITILDKEEGTIIKNSKAGELPEVKSGLDIKTPADTNDVSSLTEEDDERGM